MLIPKAFFLFYASEFSLVRKKVSLKETKQKLKSDKVISLLLDASKFIYSNMEFTSLFFYGPYKQFF